MKIPEFKNEEELEKFWDEHSTADYLEELEEVELEWEPAEDTCPRCGGEMERTAVNINLFNKIQIFNIGQYACQICGMVKFSTQALEEIRHIEYKIKRYGLAGLILQNLPMIMEKGQERYSKGK